MAAQTVSVKDLKTGNQQTVPQSELVGTIKKILEASQAS
jgi:hypothetical protein